MARAISWSFVIIFIIIPINWARIWFVGEMPASTSPVSVVIASLVLWGLATGLAYYLVHTAGRSQVRAAEIKAKTQAEYQAVLNAPLTPIKPNSARLKAGEIAYGSLPCTLQEMKTVGYTAGTSGVSVRVAKGVTLRSSGTRGAAKKGLLATATGELVITNSRLIFAGDKKSFVVQLNNLLNYTNYENGLCFNEADCSYTLLTTSTHAKTVFQITLDKVLAMKDAELA